MFCFDAVLEVRDRPVHISTLVDSGATGNVITQALVTRLNIAVTKIKKPFFAQALDGHALGGSWLSENTETLNLAVTPTHSEQIRFFVVKHT